MKLYLMALIVVMGGNFVAQGGYLSKEFYVQQQDICGPLDPIYFDFNDYRIPLGQRVTTLELNATRISARLKNADKDVIVVLEGHSCTLCKDECYNQKISELRAKETKRLLVIRGIPAHKIAIIGRGSTMCKVSCSNREQQAPNRRVEFHLGRICEQR